MKRKSIATSYGQTRTLELGSGPTAHFVHDVVRPPLPSLKARKFFQAQSAVLR